MLRIIRRINIVQVALHFLITNRNPLLGVDLGSFETVLLGWKLSRRRIRPEQPHCGRGQGGYSLGEE